MFLRRMIFIAGVMALGVAGVAYAEESPLYEVPQLDGIDIDGDDADWGDHGFRVDLLLDTAGRLYPLADLDPAFRLGWDDRGLLVLIALSDDSASESADDNKLAAGDSIEVFAATKRGDKDRYQVTISPGIAAEHPELRAKAVDFRTMEPREEPVFEAARAGEASAYTVEILLPWSNLNLAPEVGLETAFQLYINDVDADDSRYQAVWYPQTRSHENTDAMYRIRIARRPSTPVRARISGEFDDSARTHVRVVAVRDLAGKDVVVRDGRAKQAEALLTADGDFATADLLFDMPEPGSGARTLDVRARRHFLGTVTLPDADVIRAQRVMFIPLAFKPPVFKGEEFPEVAFTRPLVAERLLGACTLTTTCHDRDYNEVEQAELPGRYGAVVDITPEAGRPLRRYFTLFRAPDQYNALLQWWFERDGATLDLPPQLGIDPAVQEAERTAIGRLVGYQFTESLETDQDSAMLLAGLSEASPDMAPVTVAEDVWAADRQWWVGLKRKLNGLDREYANAFVCPYQKEGEPATVLRNGTAEEAGMKPDAVAKIDAVLNDWIAASGEPFAVCLARHGVVFFHKAYGERDGQPMTVDTKSWMASISKFLSGTLMMTLVDQDLVDLDATVDRYIPALRGIDVETPLTIRSLYTHTNGFQLGLRPPRMYPDHWGDDMNDFEQVIAGYYPYLEVGTRHGYNGVGYALGGKVMESVTGEALPQLFMRHLWGPLGCNHTDAVDGSARTFSTAMDMAVFGQMLLNKGAYGNMRFMKEETFRKSLPVKLAPYVKFDTDLEWGIGSVWMRDPGLGEKTFAHGAASAATFRIDPEHDLIIVMTRNRAGDHFGDYHPKFIQAIVEGMAE